MARCIPVTSSGRAFNGIPFKICGDDYVRHTCLTHNLPFVFVAATLVNAADVLLSPHHCGAVNYAAA